LFSLYKCYGKGDVSLSTYRLKEKLKLKYKNLIFHRSMARNRSDLVYADSVTPGGIVESAPILDDISTMDESSQDETTSAHETSFEGFSIQSNYNKEIYHTARYLRNLLLNVDTKISWPPDSEDLKWENAVDVLPIELVNFLIVMLGFSDQTVFSEKIPIPEDKEKKVVAIAQDLIHISTSGKTMTHKTMALGVAVRQISGSQRVVKILNQFGHCCSPDLLYKHDSALTKAISDEEVFIPRNISTNIPSTVVWDNNDFLEETLSGTTFRCSCKKASLRCSDLCRCKECQNCSLEYEEEEDPKLEDIYEDSDESDNNDESDSDSDYTKAAEEPRITSEWETSVVYTESGAETDSSL